MHPLVVCDFPLFIHFSSPESGSDIYIAHSSLPHRVDSSPLGSYCLTNISFVFPRLKGIVLRGNLPDPKVAHDGNFR